MTIYQKELLRQLSNLGCTGYEDDQSGMLNITMDGLPLCIAGKKGDLYWDKENVALPERRKAVDALCKAADLVREYVSLYEASPQMKPESVPEYAKLQGQPKLIGLTSCSTGRLLSSDSGLSPSEGIQEVR